MSLTSSPPSSPTNLKNLTSSDEPEKLDELRRTEQALSRMRTALKANKDVRVTLILISVVLGKDGGALGPLGTGQQWFSWIHVDDLVNVIYEALTKPSYQVINGTAPNPVRLGKMCQQLGSVFGRPSWLPNS
uniref:NAD-dependent epimerase/dehydratase domain-containing protein n=1 Tax=Brassica campestris TaxID=3711 RepID=M4DF49_BRACM